MPEEISPELAADAAAFAAALPASIEMPAGAGKTHLLSATTKHIIEAGGRVLVLTHTNAGVYAINSRLRRFGIAKSVQVSTITSFAFRLARAYPQLGRLRVPRVMVPSQSQSYVEAATRVAESENIRAVLAASFTHLLVDEYQDCSETHHAFVAAVRAAVPATGVFGDPLQAIFGFNERLADWAAVQVELPPHPTTIKPNRWYGHNEELGHWLLEIRPHMVPGHVVRWNNIALPTGVTFQNISGNPQGVLKAALTARASDETVLIIASRADTARTIAGNLNGAFTVMEEIAGKFMATHLHGLANVSPTEYPLWLFDLTKSCHCGHGVLDTQTLRKRYAKGKTASDLLAGGSSSRAGAEPAIRALDSVVLDPTLPTLAAAMAAVPTSPALQLHSHEAWYDVQASIRGATTRGDDTGVLLDELAKVREVLRYAGRRERRRIISRTLLVKGLEYDHVIIANVNEHASINDLYVALSRARKTITILGASDTLKLQRSPNGR
ncbi:UvrD-helicase domain-containing protein [Mycobacterium sp. DL99]|uniref:UvrD-helicase domain-containing protein n=1 Tax=Mycobacterium sp. DL99 TaxID=2528957 RepID=UPI001080E9CB|nr:UvrD-helicase domain-containing protein [Mycobacterium sp. DL99]